MQRLLRWKRRPMPRVVAWAVALLWSSYALSVGHEIITLRYVWTSWSPERVLPLHVAGFLVFAALIYFISRGVNWARWTYLVLFAVRLINVLLYLRQDLDASKPLVLITAISFLCLSVAIYWLFTDPGSRWFHPSGPDSTSEGAVLRS